MDGMFGEMKLRVVSLFKMAHNVPQLYLVADFENENLNYSQN